MRAPSPVSYEGMTSLQIVRLEDRRRAEAR